VIEGKENINGYVGTVNLGFTCTCCHKHMHRAVVILWLRHILHILVSIGENCMCLNWLSFAFVNGMWHCGVTAKLIITSWQQVVHLCPCFCVVTYCNKFLLHFLLYISCYHDLLTKPLFLLFPLDWGILPPHGKDHFFKTQKGKVDQTINFIK